MPRRLFRRCIRSLLLGGVTKSFGKSFGIVTSSPPSQVPRHGLEHHAIAARSAVEVE